MPSPHSSTAASDLPTSMNLGSFTLDPTAAQNPADSGHLNPATTDITSTYNEQPDHRVPDPDPEQPGQRLPVAAGQERAADHLRDAATESELRLQPVLPDHRAARRGPGRCRSAPRRSSASVSTPTGFQQYAADDFRDPSLILDGFYVSDRQNPDGTGPVAPQVQLYGSIAAYAALDLGIASAGVGGGLFASINFTVHDPSGTGLVHLEDLEADVQKGTIFDASGALQAFLDAYRHDRPGLLLPHLELQHRLGDPGPDRRAGRQQTSRRPATGDARPTATSASTSGPTPRSGCTPARVTAVGYRRQRDADGHAGPEVQQRLRVRLRRAGRKQEYDNVTEITGDGAAGNDNITITPAAAST